MDLLLVLVHFADRADAHPSGFSVRGGQMSPEEAFVGPRFVLLCEAEPLQSQSVGFDSKISASRNGTSLQRDIFPRVCD